MECPNEILFGFTYNGRGTAIIDPYTIFSTGVYNSKSYYTWYDSYMDLTFIIRWNTLDNRWEFGYDSLGTFIIIAFLNYPPLDCPLNPSNSFSWLVLNEDIFLVDINTAAGNAIPVETTEEQECYPILVWNTQCEFAQATLKYIQQMQFGIFCCKTLDKLKNKYRALEILNCYDVRDIPNNTTDYNTLTYQQIKNLLNY